MPFLALKSRLILTKDLHYLNVDNLSKQNTSFDGFSVTAVCMMFTLIQIEREKKLDLKEFSQKYFNSISFYIISFFILCIIL